MHPVAALARKAIDEYLAHGSVLRKPAKPAPEMDGRAGVFVCLKKRGQLRGCIGTFMPCHESIAEEIIHNAIAAATRDPRFAPVETEELSSLACSVDVLSPPEKIDGPAGLDPRRYGVIVVCGSRKGLLLPDLEGVDTASEQLRIARMKAGISPEEAIEIFRFEVRRYE
ncbi:MAG TPA: AmmeMemoRadiSam system protein A [Thermodesulfovibrionales bacterium]|nr:AmmeMemoRadiSam system protein A [Thermodesulfovibrionales bacterium]